MKADADFFNAYAYGKSIGKSASEVMDLPIDEVRGDIAFRRIVTEMMEQGGG